MNALSRNNRGAHMYIQSEAVEYCGMRHESIGVQDVAQLLPCTV